MFFTFTIYWARKSAYFYLHNISLLKLTPKNKICNKTLNISLVFVWLQAFPIVFAVMESRTGTAYEEIFAYIKEVIPGLSPKVIVSDYEAAIKAAVNKQFPSTKHVGCWFHFSQVWTYVFHTTMLLSLWRLFLNVNNREA